MPAVEGLSITVLPITVYPADGRLFYFILQVFDNAISDSEKKY